MDCLAVNYIHVMVPMRDGVKLCADVYLPSAEGSYPVILSRSPYNATGARSGLEWIKRGFAFVAVDTRGRTNSEGECDPGRDERNDGYDTLEWMANQPWCDGNVGMVGGSYPALTQFHAAMSGHPALKAIAPSAMSSNRYVTHYTAGALILQFKIPWYIGMSAERGVTPAKPPKWDELMREIPVATLDERAGLPSKAWKELIKHPYYDEYWKHDDLKEYTANIKAPFFIQGSWYDVIGAESINTYFDLINSPDVPENVKKHTYMRIGPWGHGVNVKEGEYSFGDESMVTEDLEIDFLMSLLTGKTPASDKEPARIAYFTMGMNKWQHTNQWPPANVKFKNYYLGSGGKANTLNGDGILSTSSPDKDMPADKFVYDPADPVPSCGGRMVGTGGQKDQTEVEQRKDVLVYTLPALKEDLEVTGPVSLKLFISSTAPDTDFTAKLVDVDPDGKPLNVCEGILRVRYRDGIDKPGKLMEPGKVYALDFYVDVTSYMFKKGHSVRLEISSSNFPHYNRNLNVAQDPLFATEMRTAEQTIYHSAEYPSHLILPVAGK